MSTHTKGSFVPQYSRTFKRGVAKASRPVMPTSGTGELRGGFAFANSQH